MNLSKVIYKCTKNDRKAQTEFYDHFAHLVGNVALRYCSDTHEAKDVMQQAFVKIFKSIKEEYESLEHLSNWVKRITINTALNHNRSKAEVIELKDEIIQNTASDLPSASIERTDLLSAMSQLRAEYQQIINLVIVDEYSHKEIADILNIKESNSRARYSRAISAMRHLMDQKQSTAYGSVREK